MTRLYFFLSYLVLVFIALIGAQQIDAIGISLLAMIGGLIVTSFRLQNSGHSGWWCFLQMIPLVNLLQLIYLLFVPTAPLISEDEYQDDKRDRKLYGKAY